MNSSNGSQKVTRLFSAQVYQERARRLFRLLLLITSTTFGNDPVVGIAYLYCNFRQQHEQTSSDLIVSLLKQLVQERPSIPDVVKNLYSYHKPKRTCPSPDEILNALHSVTAFYSKTFIVIDALDECQVSHELLKLKVNLSNEKLFELLDNIIFLNLFYLIL